MATWAFSDGAVLFSGGRVRGRGATADYLRDAIEGRMSIHVLPPPAGYMPVEPSSDFMLDVLAKVVAYQRKKALSTVYIPSLEDAPAHVRKVIEAFRKKGSSPSSVF